MRVFSAALATETNTFAPMPTGVSAFHERAYYPAGKHPDAMQMHGGPLWAAREVGPSRGWTLIEGLVAAAVPNGIVTRAAYESLRDQLLGDLKAALPVDMVLLGMHGAMVADGYDDCEGDLLARVRQIVGPDTVVGGTLDPHTHLSDAMVGNADLLICWKEYPHTDILERARELVEFCAALAEKRLELRVAVIDTGMIASLHTTREPGKSFVNRVRAREGKDGIVSISPVHGFASGDVPDMGTKVLVYSDASVDPDGARGQDLAQRLARELCDLREALNERPTGIDAAIDAALAADGTVVLGDGSDNPGGGAPGDSTYILRRLIDRNVASACLGPLWDPGAVRIAFDAGVGARLALRIGGKIGPLSGDPVDAVWEIRALKPDMVMTGLAGTPAKLGDCALIASDGVEVVLSTYRCQAFGVDLFTQLGLDPAQRKIVVVKSSQHFRASFEPIATRVIMVDAPGVVARDITSLPYRKIRRPKWPLHAS
ncbi:M81 family metallopeptidase [Bradyrhizobium sp. WYCCWR 13023]|uniref:Microcystinase C n=1 Tax=Bradyrhizobium zhengyangense TaxID=2911009 RepID=A0A9X1UCY7_9BRAD|nr:M81 family metallopeptidase [Bradyrhizobium zhengyangense]MCG2630463.1 M81 family metallopeptidase [Bradyrhizobium zhengyangense]MCG2640718.1 M81 family metallopeptidase [Bradyrhizobium zhengyangense]